MRRHPASRTDDAGTFVDGDFGFGMRRLSFDIAGGHQPMVAKTADT